MSEFKIIETQEAFDAAIRERLERQSAKHSEEMEALRAELETLKTENGSVIAARDELLAEVESHKGKLEKLNGLEEKLTALTAENSTLRNAAVRREVADKYGLPKELADRLVGTDEASLSEDAEKLASFFNAHSSARMPSPSADVVPDGETNRGAFKEMLAKLND